VTHLKRFSGVNNNTNHTSPSDGIRQELDSITAKLDSLLRSSPVVASLRLLTKKEAANLLGVKSRTLDDWREAGAIACIEKPGYVRFRLEDVQAFIARNLKEPRPRAGFRPRRHQKKSEAAGA
jgi:excisionase family DNA binding protein